MCLLTFPPIALKQLKIAWQHFGWLGGLEVTKLTRVREVPGWNSCILGYPGVIPLATSTPGTISWMFFDLPLNEYYNFIGCIIIFRWARWPMKTIYLWERLSDWTAHYNASYRFWAADSNGKDFYVWFFCLCCVFTFSSKNTICHEILVNSFSTIDIGPIAKSLIDYKGIKIQV